MAKEQKTSELTGAEIEEIRQRFIGAWHVIGHHGPKLFDEVRRLRQRVRDLEAVAVTLDPDPGKPLDQWIDDHGLRQLSEAIAIHVKEAAPEDVPRFTMISLRQTLEEKRKAR